MQRYIALLRGINISGKNKISMPELKKVLEESILEEDALEEKTQEANNGLKSKMFNDVKAYLNSGNVMFSSENKSEVELAKEITRIIKERFNLDVPTYVIKGDALKAILANAPGWWGTDDEAIYDNLIFVMEPANAVKIAEKIGEPTKELEKIEIVDNVIFWSFDRKKYAKANWWKKTAAAGIGEFLTIRTANTIKKIVEM